MPLVLKVIPVGPVCGSSYNLIICDYEQPHPQDSLILIHPTICNFRVKTPNDTKEVRVKTRRLSQSSWIKEQGNTQQYLNNCFFLN
jgi:hypothetical protein